MDREEREEQQPRAEQDQDDQERQVRRADGIRAQCHLGDDDCERPGVVEGGSQRERSKRAQPEHRIFDGGSETERLSSDSMNAPDGRDVVPDHLRIHEGRKSRFKPRIRNSTNPNPGGIGSRSSREKNRPKATASPITGSRQYRWPKIRRTPALPSGRSGAISFA